MRAVLLVARQVSDFQHVGVSWVPRELVGAQLLQRTGIWSETVVVCWVQRTRAGHQCDDVAKIWNHQRICSALEAQILYANSQDSTGLDSTQFSPNNAVCRSLLIEIQCICISM